MHGDPVYGWVLAGLPPELLRPTLDGSRIASRKASNVVESAHSAHPTRRAPLTSGPAGLSVDSIAASLMPAASRNASTSVSP
jgi:hypothetical protein